MLTFQYIPYADIDHLSSAKRINKLLDLVMAGNIILMEGRLRKEEEKDLIEITMEKIDNRFKGIELSVMNPDKDDGALVDRFKKGMANLLLGDRIGMTIIGPAQLVKDIKRDPDKIQLFIEETKKKTRRRRK
ncbi:MAG: DUF2073 domain-containing protein [DPANN group archaeon]|nr:DUF2073 domain-containing protein [DPANN group archaeon]